MTIVTPQDFMTQLEEAIAASDKEAVSKIYKEIDDAYKAMEKAGMSDGFGLEWFFSMVPFDLWPEEA